LISSNFKHRSVDQHQRCTLLALELSFAYFAASIE